MTNMYTIKVMIHSIGRDACAFCLKKQYLQHI